MCVGQDVLICGETVNYERERERASERERAREREREREEEEEGGEEREREKEGERERVREGGREKKRERARERERERERVRELLTVSPHTCMWRDCQLCSARHRAPVAVLTSIALPRCHVSLTTIFVLDISYNVFGVVFEKIEKNRTPIFYEEKGMRNKCKI